MKSESKRVRSDRCLEVAEYFIINRSTIRATADRFCLSKSTIHLDLTERLLQVSPLKAAEVREILDYNFRTKHIRGGNSTRIKKLHRRNTNGE